MMDIIPFIPDHIDAIMPQRRQAADLLCMSEMKNRPVNFGPGVTGVVNGEVIFCLGKATQWKGRHIVWSLISANAGKHMISVVRAIKRIVDTQSGEGRLEVVVRADFAEGCRLAEKIMGFKFHHYEEKFLPDGGDAKIYVRYV